MACMNEQERELIAKAKDDIKYLLLEEKVILAIGGTNYLLYNRNTGKVKSSVGTKWIQVPDIFEDVLFDICEIMLNLDDDHRSQCLTTIESVTVFNMQKYILQDIGFKYTTRRHVALFLDYLAVIDRDYN